MRIRLVGCLLGVAALGAMALPAGATAQTGDSVVGSGTLQGSLPGWRIDVDVHSGPSGENPIGGVTVTPPNPGGEFGGTVGCLQVSDNVAIVGFNLVNGPVPTARVKIVDSGTGTVPDSVWIETVGGIPPIGPGDCAQDVTVNPHTLSPGDIVVTDVDPLPTSKDQCKNGGWTTFGVFKNQGDCVSFVVPSARSTA